jgi:MYXO-CTERM domain-containing protein
MSMDHNEDNATGLNEATDASDASDAPPSDAGEDVTPLQGGCACGVVAASPPRAASLLALLGVAAHRRRRRRPRDCEEV